MGTRSEKLAGKVEMDRAICPSGVGAALYAVAERIVKGIWP